MNITEYAIKNKAVSYFFIGLVLFGGIDGPQRFDDTWEWDGQSWRQATPTVRPSAR